LTILLLLGLASFVAAATTRVQCGPVFVGRNNGGVVARNGGGAVLRNGRQCELKAGPYRMALPSWIQTVTPRLSGIFESL
jgi:hypothetical protein